MQTQAREAFDQALIHAKIAGKIDLAKFAELTAKANEAKDEDLVKMTVDLVGDSKAKAPGVSKAVHRLLSHTLSEAASRGLVHTSEVASYNSKINLLENDEDALKLIDELEQKMKR